MMIGPEAELWTWMQADLIDLIDRTIERPLHSLIRITHRVNRLGNYAHTGHRSHACLSCATVAAVHTHTQPTWLVIIHGSCCYDDECPCVRRPSIFCRADTAFCIYLVTRRLRRVVYNKSSVGTVHQVQFHCLSLSLSLSLSTSVGANQNNQVAERSIKTDCRQFYCESTFITN